MALSASRAWFLCAVLVLVLVLVDVLWGFAAAGLAFP
jgi:hypothetical protein